MRCNEYGDVMTEKCEKFTGRIDYQNGNKFESILIR